MRKDADIIRQFRLNRQDNENQRIVCGRSRVVGLLVASTHYEKVKKQWMKRSEGGKDWGKLASFLRKAGVHGGSKKIEFRRNGEVACLYLLWAWWDVAKPQKHLSRSKT